MHLRVRLCCAVKDLEFVLKESLTRDFRFQVFIMNQFLPGRLVFFWAISIFFTKIDGDICNFVFITDINDTGNKLLPVSLTPVIDLYFRKSPRIFVKL